jgi:hypothetical protein
MHGPLVLILAFLTELARVKYVQAAAFNQPWRSTLWGGLCTFISFGCTVVCVNRWDVIIWYLAGDMIGTFIAVRWHGIRVRDTGDRQERASPGDPPYYPFVGRN